MSDFGLVLLSVSVPKDLKLSVKNKVVTINGPNGTLTREFQYARAISIEKKANNISVFTYHPRKKQKSLLQTIISHIRNLMSGAEANFIYKMKIVYAHFPMTVKVEGQKVLIDNFLGERNSRSAKIKGEKTKVTIETDDIIIESPYIEDVGQTAANIRQATKIRRKDPRVFQDGIYLYYKGHGDKDLWKLKI